MTDILNLTFYKAIEVRENEGDYLVIASSTVPPTCCPKCQSLEFNKHGTREPTFMDVPTHGKRLGIRVIRQRYRCKSCGNVFIDPLMGMDEDHAMTNRLVKFIQEQSLLRTFTSIADDVGVDEKLIRNIFRAYVDVLESQHIIQTPKWLGIDEIHVLGNPRCVLTNVRERTLIDMLKTRNKPMVEQYLMKMPNRQSIEVVTMDMWQPYRDAVAGAIPQAKIVVDRFHVVKMANKALDELRKSLKAGMTTTQKRQLMRDRYVLLKRHADLQPKDLLLLETWIGNIPTLGTAYKLKEMLFDLYELKDKKEAEDRYQTWRDTLEANPEVAPFFSDLVRAITNWHDPIFNYFDFKITNGYTEAINGLIKVANRIGRGYSFEAIRAKMLFKDGHKTKPKFRRSGGNLNRTMIDKNTGEEVIVNNLIREVRTPVDADAVIDFGVPIATLTAMIDRHEL